MRRHRMVALLSLLGALAVAGTASASGSLSVSVRLGDLGYSLPSSFYLDHSGVTIGPHGGVVMPAEDYFLETVILRNGYLRVYAYDWYGRQIPVDAITLDSLAIETGRGQLLINLRPAGGYFVGSYDPYYYDSYFARGYASYRVRYPRPVIIYERPITVYHEPVWAYSYRNTYTRPSYRSGYGYAQPSYRSGYGYAQPSYRAPRQEYVAPQPSYRAPARSYSAPQGGYSAPREYRDQRPKYRAPREQVYSAPTPSYRAPRQEYVAPQPSYRAPTRSYRAPQESYSAPKSTHRAPRGGYAAPKRAEEQRPSYSAPRGERSYQAPRRTQEAPREGYPAKAKKGPAKERTEKHQDHRDKR